MRRAILCVAAIAAVELDFDLRAKLAITLDDAANALNVDGVTRSLELRGATAPRAAAGDFCRAHGLDPRAHARAIEEALLRELEKARARGVVELAVTLSHRDGRAPPRRRPSGAHPRSQPGRCAARHPVGRSAGLWWWRT